MKRKEISAYKLAVLLALMSLFMFAGFNYLSPTYGQATIVRVEAPNIIDPSTISEFNVSIIVENVEGLYGWELKLLWNDTIDIECTTEYVNTEIWPYYQGPWVTDPIDNTKGEYWQSLTATAPSEPASGTFWLANLTFTVTTPEQVIVVNFTITKALGYDNYVLLDPYANEIPHEYQHSQITIIPEFGTHLLLTAMIISTLVAIISAKREK